MIWIYDANAYLQSDMWGALSPAQSSQRTIYHRACTRPEFWIWDGFNPNARRRELFDGYKRRDHTGKEDIYAGLQLYRDILGHSAAIQIECPGWEADDVIATLAKRAGGPVTIFTNDLDQFQLTVDPNIRIVGVSNRKGIPAEYIPLYKTLVGDPSDKIPGIPGFGDKAWEALEPLWEDLRVAFELRDNDFITNKVPWKPKALAFIRENLDILYAYWCITHLYDVPIETIEQHTKVGTVNQAAAEALFERFLL